MGSPQLSNHAYLHQGNLVASVTLLMGLLTYFLYQTLMELQGSQHALVLVILNGVTLADSIEYHRVTETLNSHTLTTLALAIVRDISVVAVAMAILL